MSFDAYNESDVLIAAVERYFERTGHYPERILADKIYRNRNNLAYCREHRIRLSGPSLGRPKKNAVTDRKTEYKDNADRIAVERAFALAKQKYGLGLITSRLDETTRSSIALSVIAIILFHLYPCLFKTMSESSPHFLPDLPAACFPQSLPLTVHVSAAY